MAVGLDGLRRDLLLQERVELERLHALLDHLQVLEQLRVGPLAEQFEQLWDSQTSEFFKRQITRESFIENLTLGRQQLGAPGASAFMQVTMATSDPASGYTGEIYVFNYRNAYASGEYLERIVVVKDDDGEFRLSGLWAAALPQQPVAKQ